MDSRTSDSSYENFNEEEILCILQRNNKLAAASYNAVNDNLEILGSTESFRPEYSLIKMIVSQKKPHITVVHSCSPSDLIVAIREAREGIPIIKKEHLQRLSSKYFNYSTAKEAVLRMSLSGDVQYSAEEKFNYIMSVVNIGDERLVCVLGALLKFLETYIPTIRKQAITRLAINKITPMIVESLTWLDSETYRSLQIFDPLQHPSCFKWSSQEEMEGLSLYTLLDRHCSLLGSTKLRYFMANPTNDLSVLQQRHEVINFCINPSNTKIVETLISYARHLSPISFILENMRSLDARGKQWKCIYQNIYYSVLFAETCQLHNQEYQLFNEVSSSITNEMYSMAYHLDRVIDFERMEDNEMFIVKPNVSQVLDKAKFKYSKMTEAMNKVVTYEFDSIPYYIKKIHMLYIPEIRFLLSIPYWKENLRKEEFNLPNLEYQFSSNRTAYYKSARCHELDELLGDPQIEIMIEESNIIKALGKYIKRHLHHTLSLIKKITELDCIFGMGSLAKEYGFIQPVLVDEKSINITKGKHPLLGISIDNFIPNDTLSSPESSLVRIIYGPNASGKTVYLKQLSSCVHKSSSSSLLVLDEVGTGTTELNGTSLLASSLRYFLSKGSHSPHVFVSTALSHVSDYLNHDQLSMHMMDYSIVDGSFTFLYSLKSGNSSTSFCFEICKGCGAPEAIISTANKVFITLNSGEGAIPYSDLRIKRSQIYFYFLKKFASLDLTRGRCIIKLKKKVKQFFHSLH